MRKNKQIYVSYAWKDEDQKKIVAKLELACEKRDLILLRDKNELDYKGSIRKYMDELAAGDAIILVLSEPYFKSAYCMYEICQAHNRIDFCPRSNEQSRGGATSRRVGARLVFSRPHVLGGNVGSDAQRHGMREHPDMNSHGDCGN